MTDGRKFSVTPLGVRPPSECVGPALVCRWLRRLEPWRRRHTERARTLARAVRRMHR